MTVNIKAVLTFQEDDGGVRGEVVFRLGDVVGEIVAYLVWRTYLLIIRYNIVDISGCEGSGRYSQQQQQH